MEDVNRKFEVPEKMSYKWTAYYKTDDERIKAIVEDILKEYPRLGYLAEVAAKLETPFGQVHEDYELFSNQENHVNRLINIVIVTEGKPEFQREYEKACRDLREQYYSWQQGFTYANPDEQAAYLVWEQFMAHQRDKSVPLYTFKEAADEQRRRVRAKERKRNIEMLQYSYPGIGDLADELITMEEEQGIRFRFQEDNLLKLFYIIKLAQERPGYEQLYETYPSQIVPFGRIIEAKFNDAFVDALLHEETFDGFLPEIKELIRNQLTCKINFIKELNAKEQNNFEFSTDAIHIFSKKAPLSLRDRVADFISRAKNKILWRDRDG